MYVSAQVCLCVRVTYRIEYFFQYLLRGITYLFAIERVDLVPYSLPEKSPVMYRAEGKVYGTLYVYPDLMSGFGKDGKGVVIEYVISQALGTLGPLTGIVVGTKPAITTPFRVIKAEVVATVIGLTAGEGVGLVLYMGDGQYSLAEFEEGIEGAIPLSPNDSTEAEQALRWSKRFGATQHEEGQNAELMVVGPKGGPVMEETIRWTFDEATSFDWLCYNMGAVLTTGATIQVACKLFGVWVR